MVFLKGLCPPLRTNLVFLPDCVRCRCCRRFLKFKFSHFEVLFLTAFFTPAKNGKKIREMATTLQAVWSEKSLNGVQFTKAETESYSFFSKIE